MEVVDDLQWDSTYFRSSQNWTPQWKSTGESSINLTTLHPEGQNPHSRGSPSELMDDPYAPNDISGVERDGLNFDYPLASSRLIDMEIDIKKKLRDSAYNKQEIEDEIERSLDRRASGIPHQKILQTINIELLSPELIEMYGEVAIKSDVDVVHADLDENCSEEHEDVDEEGSLEGGDDYNNYYNEEEVLDEKEVEEEFHQ